MLRQCFGLNRAGSRCGAWTGNADGLCWHHQGQTISPTVVNEVERLDRLLKDWLENGPACACQRPPWWRVLEKIDAEKVIRITDQDRKAGRDKAGKEEEQESHVALPRVLTSRID